MKINDFARSPTMQIVIHIIILFKRQYRCVYASFVSLFQFPYLIISSTRSVCEGECTLHHITSCRIVSDILTGEARPTMIVFLFFISLFSFLFMSRLNGANNNNKKYETTNCEKSKTQENCDNIVTLTLRYRSGTRVPHECAHIHTHIYEI